MRAAIVEREDAAPVMNHQDRSMAAVHDEPAFRLQFIKRTCEFEFRVWVHQHARGS
jgi:hypothetical protein